MAKALTQRVVKAFTLLGSSQGINMVCSVVRMKLLTILVGPVGVGLMGALNQAVDMISNFSQLNVRTTAVRDLAAAPPERYGAVLVSVRRYGRLLGCLGLALMFFLAPALARFTFGDTEFAWAYRIASLSVLFQALQGAETVVLQAAGRYKAIAASGLFTALTGLVLALALYWGLRLDGVAPSLVAYALMAWLGAMWLARRYRYRGPRPSWRSSLAIGSGFVALGAVLTLTNLLAEGVNFLFLSFIGNEGKVTLGLYQAGYTVIWRYAAYFFVAFSFEFYPRISRMASRPSHMVPVLTHQALVSTWMFIPCAIAVILLAPWLMRLLYSSEFLPAVPYVMLGMAGMVPRATSMTLSYSFLAANRGRAYAVTELSSAVVGLVLNVAGYRLAGFAGLGVACVVWMLAELALVYLTARACRLALPRPRALILAVSATLLLAALSLILI